MRLFLVRHGQTVENAERIIQGQSDGTLSEDGREQVRCLAERLKDEDFDVIISSDLGRATETTREIAKFHPDVPLEYSEELRERDAGPYTSKRKDEVSWDWNSLPEEVEGWESMRKRVTALLDSLLDRYPEGNVLVVSHGGPLNALIGIFTGKPPEGNTFIRLGNTSITVVEITKDREHQIQLLNCVDHLG